MTLIIPGTLPNLNDYIDAERRNKYAGAKLKRQSEQVVMLAARRQIKKPFPASVVMQYTWYERDRRRDKDNISSFGRKVIQDALVKAGLLKNDGWAEIEGFSDSFFVDKKNPRIEVAFYEKMPQNKSVPVRAL